MNMFTFGIIGFERWGGLRPVWKKDGKKRKWIPLILGIWLRVPTRKDGD